MVSVLVASTDVSPVVNEGISLLPPPTLSSGLFLPRLVLLVGLTHLSLSFLELGQIL